MTKLREIFDAFGSPGDFCSGDSGEEMEKDVSHVNKVQQMPTICLQYAYNSPKLFLKFSCYEDL